MVHSTGWESERKITSILKILSRSSRPLGSAIISRELKRDGIFLSERAIRNHLRIADERHYTQPMGRPGRMITSHGLDEIREALAVEQVGFIREKLETLAFQTTFDPQKRTGKLSINTSIIDSDKFGVAVSAMKDTFKAGICVSDLVATACEGEALGSVVIPNGKIGLATVCSVVINGVLLKAGIPTEYKFGGILEIKNREPNHFVAVLDYSSTSLDPSELFIRAGMTSVREVVKTGNGKVIGVFRTIPTPARSIVEKKIAVLRKAGIKGVFALGNTSEPLCNIPVELNRVGIIQFGGLNPVAAVREVGIQVDNIAESGVIDFGRLHPIWDL